MKGLTAVAVLVVSALFAASANADVRYASPAGSGSACTHADPCALRRAIEGGAVRFGDEVIVLGGTYDLGDRHVLVDRGIRVHGVSGAPRPTIVSHDFTTLWVFHRAAVVSDLEVVNSSAMLASAVTVSDGILDRLRARSPATGCALFPDVEGQLPLIRNSFCWGTSAHGYGLQWGIGAGTEVSWTARLRGVTAIGGQSGLRMDAGSGPVHLKLDAANVIVRGGVARDIVARAEAGGNTIRMDFSHSNYARKAGFAGTAAGFASPGRAPAPTRRRHRCSGTVPPETSTSAPPRRPSTTGSTPT